MKKEYIFPQINNYSSKIDCVMDSTSETWGTGGESAGSNPNPSGPPSGGSTTKERNEYDSWKESTTMSLW